MSIYNHKHLQPTGASTQPPSQGQSASHARVNDAIDIIRQEFDVLAGEIINLRGSRDDFESKLTGQVNELNIIRSALYELESQHNKLRQQWEDESRALHQENHSLRQQLQARDSGQGLPPPPVREGIASLGRPNPERDRELLLSSAQPPPPSAGPRDSRELGIPSLGGLRGEGSGRDHLGLGRPAVLGGPGGPAAPGEPLGPLSLTPHAGPVGLGVTAGATPYPDGGFYGRAERERERENVRDRDRELRERDKEDFRREQERGREDIRDRDLMRDRTRARDDRARDRDADTRDVKRIKTEGRGKLERPDQYSPSLNPLSHHPQHQPISLGPPPPGPAQNLNQPPPPSSTNGPPLGPTGGPGLNQPPTPGGPNTAAGPSTHPTPKLPPAPGPPYPSSGGPVQLAPPPGSAGVANGNQPPPPSQAGSGPHPPTPTSANPPTSAGPSGPPVPTTPGGSNGLATVPPGGNINQVDWPNGGIDLGLDPQNVPPEMKKEGSDWFAIFNPKTMMSTSAGGKDVGKKRLDVELVHTLIHESVVCCVRFSSDGKYLATGCNRTAQIYDVKTGSKTCVLVDEDVSKTGDLYIRSVCFSPDGQYLATGAEDKRIRIWDIAKRKIKTTFNGHSQEIYSLDFSKDGRLIVSGSGDKTARIWDMEDPNSNSSITLTINEPDNVDAGVTSVCISPDGRLVAAGSLDTIVRIWDVATGNLIERLKGHRDSVYSVAFTPDGKGLVSGSLDKTLKYWDVRPILRGAGGAAAKNGAGPAGKEGSQCTKDFIGHKDYVLSVAVSHDGQWVVSGSKDRGVQFWDAKTAIAQCMLQGHKNSVISIDLSPSTSYLATGSGDWQARIWSYQSS